MKHLNLLQRLSGAHVMVIGDVMLDRYWAGDTRRISPEAPVPVVHVRGSDDKPGGAANVALNLAALGVETTLLGLVGRDMAARQLRQVMDETGISATLLETDSAPTITKLRILSRNQQLMRLDTEEDFAHADTSPLVDAFNSALQRVDLVILSDYDKGTLDGLHQTLINACRQQGVPVLADPKGSDFEKYTGCTLITPNRQEFEQVVGHAETEAQLQVKATHLLTSLELDALLLTRSEDGMSLYQADEKPKHHPAHVREVFDVTGAGDTVIAVLAAALAAQVGLGTAVQWANTAAGVVVGRLGASCLSLEDLSDALHQQYEGDQYRQGVFSEQQLLRQVKKAKRAGERLVMTNGCFDLLHVGHIRYLQAARQLGDRLIVAVNSDASVSQLKGSSRPIVALEQRMEMLAALECVDWVVGFGEETPARLIAEVTPDTLVKGGDYQPEEIAGYEHVTQRGGEVKVLDFVPGCSTSEIVEKIKR